MKTLVLVVGLMLLATGHLLFGVLLVLVAIAEER